MTEFQHTEACKQYRERMELAKVGWLARWPNHCPKCLGMGVFSVGDSVPYGSTNVTLWSEEPCETCGGAEKCPRCGAPVPFLKYESFWESGDPCPECGYAWGRGADDMMPDYDGDCNCMEDWLDDQQLPESIDWVEQNMRDEPSMSESLAGKPEADEDAYWDEKAEDWLDYARDTD